MSMNFNKPITLEDQSFIREFMGDKLTAIDESSVLFDASIIQGKEMRAIARRLNQVVEVELNESGEIKIMSDGSRYQVTASGWKKL